MSVFGRWRRNPNQTDAASANAGEGSTPATKSLDADTKLDPVAAAERGKAVRAEYDKRWGRGDLAAVELLRDLRHLEEMASQVRGRHYVDWVPVLDGFRSSGREQEGLDLLLEIVDAAERAALVSGREPAPGYTHRAAVIYRRRKDYAAEIAIIERWQAACPPERRGPGATQAKLTQRLEKARQLLQARH